MKKAIHALAFVLALASCSRHYGGGERNRSVSPMFNNIGSDTIRAPLVIDTIHVAIVPKK